MMHLFQKEKFNSTLYDLELKVEAQQKQINELRELVLQLSKDIHSLQLEVSYLTKTQKILAAFTIVVVISFLVWGCGTEVKTEVKADSTEMKLDTLKVDTLK